MCYKVAKRNCKEEETDVDCAHPSDCNMLVLVLIFVLDDKVRPRELLEDNDAGKAHESDQMCENNHHRRDLHAGKAFTVKAASRKR